MSTALHNSPGERELMLDHVNDSINFQDLTIQQRIAHHYLRQDGQVMQAWSFIQNKAQIRRYCEIDGGQIAQCVGEKVISDVFSQTDAI